MLPTHKAVRDLLARTANPERPNEVDVSRPSDALAAEAAAESAFTGLLLGLGAVALPPAGSSAVLPHEDTYPVAVEGRRALLAATHMPLAGTTTIVARY